MNQMSRSGWMRKHRTDPGRCLLPWILLGVAWPALAGQAIDERQPAPRDGRVEVINLAGEIVITGWEEEAIQVKGWLGRGVERLDFIRDGALTVIEVVYPPHGRNRGGSELRIFVPSSSTLDVNAVSADVSVKGVTGRQQLNTVSGDISSEASSADLEADTVSGDLLVTGRDVSTHAALSTISGRIEALGVGGELEASTVSGRIEARATHYDRARLNTTNGRISIEGGLADGGRYDLSTTSGRVEVLLDHGRDLHVEARNFSGAIHNCFGVVASTGRYTPERSLRFSTGEATRTIRIRSMSGRIEICSSQRD